MLDHNPLTQRSSAQLQAVVQKVERDFMRRVKHVFEPTSIRSFGKVLWLR